MKKSNVLVYAVATVASVFLLWLWYHHGLNHVDAPFDLVLSIVWWALILISGLGIHHVEKRRQERRRTCFIAQDQLFNAEVGALPARGAQETLTCLREVIDNLTYDFAVADLPTDDAGNTPHYDAVVHTKTFRVKRAANERTGQPEELEWTGEVAFTARPDDDPLPFDTPERLGEILDALMATYALKTA